MTAASAGRPVVSSAIRLRILMEPRHGARYDDILALALATERAGFDIHDLDHIALIGAEVLPQLAALP